MTGVGYRISGKVPDLARWNHARLGLGTFAHGMARFAWARRALCGRASASLQHCCAKVVALIVGTKLFTAWVRSLDMSVVRRNSKRNSESHKGGWAEVGDSRLVLCQRPLRSVVNLVRSCGAFLVAMHSLTVMTSGQVAAPADAGEIPHRGRLPKTFLHEECKEHIENTI